MPKEFYESSNAKPYHSALMAAVSFWCRLLRKNVDDDEKIEIFKQTVLSVLGKIFDSTEGIIKICSDLRDTEHSAVLVKAMKKAKLDYSLLPRAKVTISINEVKTFEDEDFIDYNIIWRSAVKNWGVKRY